MNRKNTRNTRDLGFGAGKGDVPRTIFNAEWRARFDLIGWPSCRCCGGAGKILRLDAPAGCSWCFGTGKNLEGFQRDGANRLIKRYK